MRDGCGECERSRGFSKSVASSLSLYWWTVAQYSSTVNKRSPLAAAERSEVKGTKLVEGTPSALWTCTTRFNSCQNLALMANCGDCCCSVEENLWPTGSPIAKPATSANGSNCLYKLTTANHSFTPPLRPPNPRRRQSSAVPSHSHGPVWRSYGSE